MASGSTEVFEEVGVQPSLRERKKQSTRDALRRSALRLMADRGHAAVTVEDIAAGADVSPRTFFNYFPTKEDAVSGWDPATMAEMIERLRQRPAAEPAPIALRAVVLGVLSSFDPDHQELLERLQLIRSDPHLMAHHASRWGDVERQLATALAERRGTDPDHDHFAWLVVANTLSTARVALMAWCDDGGKASLAEELVVHLDILAAGLVEPKRSMS